MIRGKGGCYSDSRGWACPGALAPPRRFNLSIRVGLPRACPATPVQPEYPRGLAPRLPRHGGRNDSRVGLPCDCPATAVQPEYPRGLHPRSPRCRGPEGDSRVGLPRACPAAAVRNDSRVACLSAYPATPVQPEYPRGLAPPLPPQRFAMIAAWLAPRLPCHGGSTRVSAWACPRLPRRRGSQ